MLGIQVPAQVMAVKPNGLTVAICAKALCSHCQSDDSCCTMPKSRLLSAEQVIELVGDHRRRVIEGQDVVIVMTRVVTAMRALYGWPLLLIMLAAIFGAIFDLSDGKTLLVLVCLNLLAWSFKRYSATGSKVMVEVKVNDKAIKNLYIL